MLTIEKDVSHIKDIKVNEDGYKLDNEMNRNLCADGYISNTTEELECIIRYES